MISALTYVPRRTPLGRAGTLAACTYLFAFAAAAFITSNPIVLAGIGAGVVVAGLKAGAKRALLLSLRWALTLAAFVIVTNAIASQRGDTILIRGTEVPILGQIDVSLEALVEGAILALRIGVVIAASAVFTACVDPDRVLRLLRPLTPRSALTSAVIVRMVPVAAADNAALREAATLRGPAAEPVGRAALARRLIAGSLDRAVDVAATLELRGYAHGAPRRAGRTRRSPSSLPFALAGVAVAALVIAARVAGLADYESYPTIELNAGAATWLIAAALPLLAVAPFWLDESRRRLRRLAPRRRRMAGGSVA